MAAPISTTYDAQERAAAIAHILCEVAAGESVASAIRIARAAGKCVPSKSVFWMWHLESEELQDQLARARLNGVEANIEDAQDIIDGRDLKRDADGTLVNPQDAYLMETNRAKARAHYRLKRAEMIAPRKYGPKLDVTTDGGRLAGSAPPDVAAQVVTILDSVAERTGMRAAGVPDVDPRTLDLLG